MPSLEAALRVACEAAREAGAMLRREANAPAGPRGHDAHADVDEEAERVIRARLEQAFPQWSYLGEETGRTVTDDAATFWLVDPNDGTRAYLQGQRGSAVSIALIRAGVPVLGVVYAPCYPDDGGDFICWAEGCGPIRRNGRPLALAPLPVALQDRHVVFLSSAADRTPDAHLRCVAPARMRTMPSIAYRLALVAVGEGEAAISLNHPGWLDVAGGHALLRARGGEVTDGRGVPVRYPTVGNGIVRQCFAGAPSVCVSLAGRAWDQVQAEAAVEEDPLRFGAQPRNHCAEGALARAQGVLLGQLAGDSLGSLVEFQTPHRIREAYGDGPRDMADAGAWKTLAGQPTDDSELALALARSLLRRGSFDEDTTFEAYRTWLASNPFDVGDTTRAALSRHSHRDPGAIAGSEANGALMRVSPLGIAGCRDVERAVAWAVRDAGLTHPHPLCAEANAVFVRAIATGLAGGTRHDMYRAALDASTLLTRDALERAQWAPPPDFQRQQGWVRTALHNAFHRLLHAETLEQAVIDTVREGGDADTNAAITGALMGALCGREGVPERWRRDVLSCRPSAAYAATQRPRPAWCWPVDALEIAERLLCVGD